MVIVDGLQSKDKQLKSDETKSVQNTIGTVHEYLPAKT